RDHAGRLVAGHGADHPVLARLGDGDGADDGVALLDDRELEAGALDPQVVAARGDPHGEVHRLACRHLQGVGRVAEVERLDLDLHGPGDGRAVDQQVAATAATAATAVVAAPGEGRGR